VRRHIEAIAARTDDELEQLAERLRGASSDRSEPGALDWLRRWRPAGPAPLVPLCECASGRCLLCN
jgi:hypothetical protein